MDLASNPTIQGVTMTGNGRNGLLVDGGTLSLDNAWACPDIAYLLMGTVTVPAGKTLTIQPGMVVKFDAGRDFAIQVNGTLLAPGTAAKPIYFTTSYDDTVGGDTNGDGSARIRDQTSGRVLHLAAAALAAFWTISKPVTAAKMHR